MKRIAAISAAALMFVRLFSLVPPAQAGAEEPTLTSAVASFHTNDDDKNSDTILTISIEKGHDEFAKITGIRGTFHDHSDHGPFGLNIEGRIRKSDLRDATTTLTIQLDGNDTWRFNYSLVLQFSDGSIQKWSWSHHELKEGGPPLILRLAE